MERTRTSEQIANLEVGMQIAAGWTFEADMWVRAKPTQAARVAVEKENLHVAAGD
jgi:hypothetical protein